MLGVRAESIRIQESIVCIHEHGLLRYLVVQQQKRIYYRPRRWPSTAGGVLKRTLERLAIALYWPFSGVVPMNLFIIVLLFFSETSSGQLYMNPA